MRLTRSLSSLSSAEFGVLIISASSLVRTALIGKQVPIIDSVFNQFTSGLCSCVAEKDKNAHVTVEPPGSL